MQQPVEQTSPMRSSGSSPPTAWPGCPSGKSPPRPTSWSDPCDSAELLEHAFATANERLEQRLSARLPAVQAAAERDDADGLREASLALLAEFLPLDGNSAAECSARTEFRLASRGNAGLQAEAERGYRAAAAVVGQLIQAFRPEGRLEDLVVEAERLMSLLDGLSLHALVHTRWLDAAMCRSVLLAHLASLESREI